MESLYEQFAFKLRNVNYKHKRFLYDKVDWSRKLVIIKGTRKVGKSTLALQYVKENYKLDKKVLYVSSDNIYFSENTILHLVEKFVSRGGKHIFIDEVHKYPTWQSEIQKVLNKFVNLKIVLIGTSVENYTDSFSSYNDFVEYELPGLSFREFILFSTGTKFENVKFRDVLTNHVDIASEITRMIDPVTMLPAFYKYGYYPFFVENRSKFFEFLTDSINLIVETDITRAKKVDFNNVQKIKRLLYYVANNQDVKPNITHISDNLKAGRKTVLEYLGYLHEANLISLLKGKYDNESNLTKAEKIYFDNTNIHSVLYFGKNINDSIQKTFFQSQVSVIESINTVSDADFLVNKKYSFTIGDASKVSEIDFAHENKFFAADNIEIGVKNKIPLWMFGFLY